MAEKIPMLALSPTMEEGTIVKWRKQEGDTFAPGDVLCDVETDKAVMEYEATNSGTLRKILTPEGQSVPVGKPIAIVGEPDENIENLLAEAEQPPAPEKVQKTSAGEKTEPAPPKTETPAPPAAPQPPQPATKTPSPQLRSSPAARRLAEKYHLDWKTITGTGPRGRIVKQDIEKALKKTTPSAAKPGPTPLTPPAPLETDQTIPVSQKRRIIAQRLSESKFTAPHYYLKTSVWADPFLHARREINQTASEKISLNAFLIKFVAEALRRHPAVNATWNGDTITRHARIDIALAVAQPDGLITPVVRNCAAKGILAIDRELQPLIEKARHGTLEPEQYANSTFTISNLGLFDIDEFTAIINPPNAAILAVGRISRQPVLDDNDQLSPQSILRLTLSCDHRLIDGITGATFLTDLKKIIQSPLSALL